MENQPTRRWLRLERLARRFGYTADHRIPVVGMTMYPDHYRGEGGIPSKDSGGVVVLRIDDASVQYQLPDGTRFTRSKRGFMKNYSRLPNTRSR